MSECIFSFSEVPTSVNASKKAFAARGKVHFGKSKKYKGWRALASSELIAQKGFVFDKPFYYAADIRVSHKSRCDLDNHIKAVLDILIFTKKIPDDRYLVQLKIAFSDMKGCSVVIRNEPFLFNFMGRIK